MLKVLAFLLALAPLPALAQAVEGHLTMTGIAQVDAVPDIVRASGGVYVEDDSAAEVSKLATRRMAALSDAMKSFGTVATSRIVLGQDRSRTKSLMGSGDAGFSARGTVTVTLTDPTKAGEALDALVKAGVEGVARLHHDIADRAPSIREAREKAVADAFERAETYARAAGLTLGPIVDLSETGASGGQIQSANPYGAHSSYGANGATGPVNMAFTATVRIRWALE